MLEDPNFCYSKEEITVPKLKLTEKAVAKLKAPDPSGNQVLHWDTATRGFGVRISGTTNNKSYIVQRAIRGKTRRITIGATNVLDLGEARRRAEVVLADFYRGVDPRARTAASATLRQVMEEYLAKQDLKPRSREAYRATIEGHLADWLDRPLASIDRGMVEARHRSIALEVEARQAAQGERSAALWERRSQAAQAQGWLDAAARHRARAAAATSRRPANGFATANGVMRSLRALWNFIADRHPEIGANPVRLKRQWHPVHPRERHLRHDEMARFYQAVMSLESTVGRDFLLLLLHTGLRRREAADLRWAAVDLQGRVIRISAEKTKAKRKLDLPMTDFVHAMMVARRALGRTDHVFPANSKSGHVEEPRFFLDQVAATTGIRISCHDLRRTYITIAESCDISPIALRALVNHSLGKDVTSGYVQMSVERLRAPAQKVCDRIKALCGVEELEGANVARMR
jgi:integrase